MKEEMSDITNYPLCWPDNVPRIAPHARSTPRFEPLTVARAVDLLMPEINRLNKVQHFAHDDSVIISTNLRPKLSCAPASTAAEPNDPGAAVYFQLQFTRNGKAFERPVVLTCDKWVRVSWNLYAIFKDIEAQRGRARWGATNIEQAFRGYLAIPERCGGKSWWDTLGIDPAAAPDIIKGRFKDLAKRAHPDKGGDRDNWTRLQEAFDQAMAAHR